MCVEHLFTMVVLKVLSVLASVQGAEGPSLAPQPTKTASNRA